MQKCKYAEVYISVNGSSKKKRCCICCIYLHISVYIHIFAGFQFYSCPIPADSWGFLQEWEGHCKVLVASQKIVHVQSMEWGWNPPIPYGIHTKNSGECKDLFWKKMTKRSDWGSSKKINFCSPRTHLCNKIENMSKASKPWKWPSKLCNMIW